MMFDPLLMLAGVGIRLALPPSPWVRVLAFGVSCVFGYLAIIGLRSIWNPSLRGTWGGRHSAPFPMTKFGAFSTASCVAAFGLMLLVWSVAPEQANWIAPAAFVGVALALVAALYDYRASGR